MKKIIADYREKNSLVAAELAEHNIDVEFEHLKVSDYLIGNTAIERKTISDFLSSMINKRLVRQLEEIKQYPKKILIIEGIQEQEIYNDLPEGINGNAIRGFLLSILLEFGVPIIYTQNCKDTAKFLMLLSKKQPKNHISLRANKIPLNKKQQKQYILEGYPGIGPATAKKLLKKYKSIKNILNQPIENLKQDIGKKAEIFRINQEKY
jgi:Fanconi anemia group M protein